MGLRQARLAGLELWPELGNTLKYDDIHFFLLQPFLRLNLVISPVATLLQRSHSYSTKQCGAY